MSARRDAGTVRLGPVSVFVLVMGICLAVLAVLCLATAQAQLTVANRQVEALEASYANERAAQAVLGQVEGSLAASREAGLAQADALAAIDGALSEVPAAADGVTYGIERAEDVIEATFTSGDARTLSVRLAVDESLTCTVEAWVTSSEIPEDEGPSVWQGPGA